MTDLIILPPNLDLELNEIARRHRKARGLGMQILTLVGGQAEGLLDRLPQPVQDGLGQATERALEVSFQAAKTSGAVPLGGDWLKRALTVGTGAAGGLGGLPSALAELPVTVTILLRAIRDIASEHGIDPDTDAGRAACLQVFASAGPLAEDDGVDTGLMAARLTLTGATVHGLIARVAPQLTVVMGQKLAAQTVPVLGAAAGAATNFVFTGYYQDMARVHFGLLRISRAHGIPFDHLVTVLAEKLGQKRLR